MWHRPPPVVQRLFWNIHSATWDAGADSSELAHVLAWAAQHVPRHGAVLDLGCGTGSHAIALARLGHPVLGLDFARGMIRRATRKARREQAPASFRLADLNRPFPVSAGAFSGALSVSVLQCMLAPPAFLGEVRRSLSVDGTCLLGVKTTPGQTARSAGWFGAFKRRASRASFLHGFTSATLRGHLLDVSLQPITEVDAEGWIWMVARAV